MEWDCFEINMGLWCSVINCHLVENKLYFLLPRQTLSCRYWDRLESLYGASGADPRGRERLCCHKRWNWSVMVYPCNLVSIGGQRSNGSYPAGHVWIYTALYKTTSNGRDIFSGQVVFMLLYLTTLAVTLSLYRTAKVYLPKRNSKLMIGSSVYTTSAVSVKTITQYLYTAIIQWLLDTIIPSSGMLVIREATMDNGRNYLRSGLGSQNECFALLPRNYDCHHAGNGSGKSNPHRGPNPRSAGISPLQFSGWTKGVIGGAIHSKSCTELRLKSFWFRKDLFLGMDGKLAFYGGKYIFIEEICLGFIIGSFPDTPILHRYSMATVLFSSMIMTNLVGHHEKLYSDS